jgi:beta-lactamase class A
VGERAGVTGLKSRIFMGLAGVALFVSPLDAQYPQPVSFAPQARPASFADQIAANAFSDTGRIGVAATDLETGETISYAGHDPFPMASTVKVAIAAAYLNGVDNGRFDLDQVYRFGRRGRVRVTARQLLERMLIRSDNVAADILLRTVGGTQAVNNWLLRAGVRGAHMDRTIARLVRDDRWRTGRVLPANLPRTPLEVAQSATLNDDGQINPAFVGDARDTATPSAMVQLLAKLHRGALLSEQSTRYLFQVMARCVTGPHRIKGALPAGTQVAHKTGTLAGVSDDVGIVTLPNGHHLAVALFAKGMRSEWERDRTIAQLARLLYDGFGNAFGPVGGSMGRTVAR